MTSGAPWVSIWGAEITVIAPDCIAEAIAGPAGPAPTGRRVLVASIASSSRYSEYGS